MISTFDNQNARPPLRVAIADDHPALLFGISHALKAIPGVVLAGTSHNSTELVQLLRQEPVDIVLSDYVMPGGSYADGMVLFQFLKRHFPAITLIVLTVVGNAGILHSLLNLGVKGLLSKGDSLTHLGVALQAAIAGRVYLSPGMKSALKARHESLGDASKPQLTKCELEVVRLFVSGLRINEIADRLHRSRQTVSTQKVSAMRKLGIQHNADLIKYGMESRLETQSAGMTQNYRSFDASARED